MILESKDIILNHVYEGKRSKRITVLLGEDLIDDRQVIWRDELKIQYDSPSISNGRHYSTTTIEKFINWAGRDITKEMPKDLNWRKYVDKKK